MTLCRNFDTNDYATLAFFIWLVLMSFGLTAENLSFTVRTVHLNRTGDVTGVIPSVELLKISPIGARGDSSDIECDGISNESGELTCLVMNCSKDVPFTSTYQIDFKSPTLFGEASSPRVRVKKCDVTPESIDAGFTDRVIIANYRKEDLEFFYGTNARMFADISALDREAYPELASLDEYSSKLEKLLSKPMGYERASDIRRFTQDSSFIALKKNDRGAALGYSKLLTVHANTLFKHYWTTKSNQDPEAMALIVNSGLERISTLKKNTMAVSNFAGGMCYYKMT